MITMMHVIRASAVGLSPPVFVRWVSAALEPVSPTRPFETSFNATASKIHGTNRGRNRRALAQTLGCIFNIRICFAITPDNNPCRHDGDQTLGDIGQVKEVVPAIRVLARLQR